MLAQSLARNVLVAGRRDSARVRKSAYPFLVAWPGSLFSMKPLTPCLAGPTPEAIVDQPTSLMVSAAGGV